MTEPEVLVAGETLIDFLPARPGPLDEVERFDRRAGGAPANVAVALARLERAPRFWTRVGDDPFGRYLAGVLAENGIPDEFVERDPDAKTTLAFVTHDEAGDRSFTFYREGTADTRMRPGAVPDNVLDATEWVHAGGVTCASGGSREATIDLLERASRTGCTVSFDPNARPKLWPDEGAFERVVREAIASVDVLKATVEELRALGFAGDSPEALARDAVGRGPHTVFVTLGDRGAVGVASSGAPWADAATGHRVARHGGYDVDVVDTTGAGDAFVAGAIVALLERADLEAALEYAGAVAASSTTAAGAMAALPDRGAVETVRSSAAE